MGKIDVLTKKYMSDAEHFSDAFNYLLFNGEQRIRADSLMAMDATELGIVLKNKKTCTVQKIRDILKQCVIKNDGKITYVILGIENQAYINYALIVKNMIYDALNYGEQVSEIAKKNRKDKKLKEDEFLSGFSKEDKLYPVITLTIYFGADDWDAPRSLYEMFGDIPSELLKYVDNYHSNIIVPKEIKDFSRFSSELKNVLEFIAISDDKSKLNEIKNDSSYEHLEIDTVQLINECTNSKISIAQGEKEVNMFKGLEDLMDDCREEGRCESIERMLRMGRTPEEIADFCGYDLDKVKQVEQKMLAIR